METQLQQAAPPAAVIAPKICSVPGCERTVTARELCRRHYDQDRLGRDKTPHDKEQGPEKICSFEGCHRGVTAHGLCHAHYAQKRRGVPLAPIRVITHQTHCNFRGCDKPHYTKGYCHGHFAQLRRGKPLRRLKWHWDKKVAA